MEKQEAATPNTLERILDSAEALFAARGFYGVTTREIAKEAGISIQTLHYHCETKANLYLMVMERAIIPAMKMIDEAVVNMSRLAPSAREDFLKAVDNIIDDIFDLFHRNPHYPRLYFRQYMEQNMELMRVELDRLVPVLRQWARLGEAFVNQGGKGGVDILLLLLDLSPMYASLFVNSDFTSLVLGEDKNSMAYLERLKTHAKDMTHKMMGF